MFREVLHKAIENTEGCIGILIMGIDGIAVEQVWKNDVKPINAEIILAEYTSLLRNAKRINDELLFSQLEELTTSSDNRTFILRFVNRDYFLAMILERDGNYGRGRYEMRCAELILGEDLVI
jgi:predicted regulator of Ras-like GTPase activity (Roadblock/LC7/MglB family)